MDKAGSMDKEAKSIELWRSVVAECLATFFYIFIACSSTINWDITLYKVGLSTADILHVSLAFGLTICALTQCFGHISGGHFNPAITFGAMATCKVSPLRGALYVAGQVGGAIAGAALLYGLAPAQIHGPLGVTSLNPILTPAKGFAVEFLLTFIYAFTFFATVDPKRRQAGNEAVPLGLSMTLVHLVGYRLTGSSCNPARSLGPAFVKNHWIQHWIYWTGPCAGSLLAALLYEYIFDPSRKMKTKERSQKTLKTTNKIPSVGYVNAHVANIRRPPSRSSLSSKSRGRGNTSYAYDKWGLLSSRLYLTPTGYKRHGKSPKLLKKDNCDKPDSELTEAVVHQSLVTSDSKMSLNEL